MAKNISILIYEKEKHLNSILYNQILDENYYELCTIHDQTKLFELVNKKLFDICILNLQDFESNFQIFVDKLIAKNKNVNIIGYYDKLQNYKIINNYKIILFKIPFRLSNLLAKLYDIRLIKNTNSNNNKFLMSHLEFSPNRKTISNLNTKNTLHLTEKENHLLSYLFNKRNLELTKNELLTDIWGVTEDLNTHTLETHIYRLKKKLNKLEPNLSFSLTNQNGLYCIKY